MEDCIKECSLLKNTKFPYLIKDKISKDKWESMFPDKNYQYTESSDLIYTGDVLIEMKSFFINFNKLFLDGLIEDSLKKIGTYNKYIIVWDPVSLLWKQKNIIEACNFLQKNILSDVMKLEIKYNTLKKYFCDEKEIELRFIKIREEINKSEKLISKQILNYINRTDKEEIKKYNNENEELIAFGDKYVLNLKTKEKRLREYDDYFINIIEYRNILETEPVCFPITDSFDPKDIPKIQILLGSLLSSKNEQLFYFFHGSGANGKSTLLYILETLLGKYFIYVSDELFTKANTSRLEETYKLDNKRIAAFDGKEINRFSEAKLINLVERYKKCKFVISLNHLPKLSTDVSIKRRTVDISFIYKFKGYPIYGTDKEIIHPLNIDYDYVFSWLLEGCSKYLNSGEPLIKFAHEYIEQSEIFGFDTFQDFVEKKIIKTENQNDIETFRNFYLVYKEYMIERLEESKGIDDTLLIEQYQYPLKEKEFLKMAKDSFRYKKTKRGNVFMFIKIKQNLEDDNQA